MATTDPAPSHAHNMRLIGHTDQNGRGDGQQIMVQGGHAYIGHVCSRGFSVVDVRDPTAEDRELHREPAEHLEPAPAGARRPAASGPRPGHVLAAGDGGRAQLLQAEGRAPRRPRDAQTRNWSAGMAVFDISEPAAPRRLHAGRGHRAAPHLVCRRPRAYASAMMEGFSTTSSSPSTWPTRPSPRSSADTGCRA